VCDIHCLSLPSHLFSVMKVGVRKKKKKKKKKKKNNGAWRNGARNQRKSAAARIGAGAFGGAHRASQWLA